MPIGQLSATGARGQAGVGRGEMQGQGGAVNPWSIHLNEPRPASIIQQHVHAEDLKAVVPVGCGQAGSAAQCRLSSYQRLGRNVLHLLPDGLPRHALQGQAARTGACCEPAVTSRAGVWSTHGQAAHTRLMCRLRWRVQQSCGPHRGGQGTSSPGAPSAASAASGSISGHQPPRTAQRPHQTAPALALPDPAAAAAAAVAAAQRPCQRAGWHQSRRRMQLAPCWRRPAATWGTLALCPSSC